MLNWKFLRISKRRQPANYREEESGFICNKEPLKIMDVWIGKWTDYNT